MTNYQEVVPNDVEQEKLNELRRKHRLQFDKEKTALKFYMLGKGYHLGLKALGFLETHSLTNHDGSLKLRKDKATPEMHHMIRIAFSVTQLRDVQDEETCIVLALLHDVQEDEEVDSSVIEREFGKRIAEKNWKLTKKFAGQHKNAEMFYNALSEDRETSIDKGLDRCDNLENMIGVFGWKKIVSYCDEAENVYLPMLHRAAKLFPEQQYAYYAIRLRMKRAIKAGRDHANSLSMFEIYRDENQRLRELVDQKVAEGNAKVNEVLGELDLVEKKLAKTYALTGSGTYEDNERKVKVLIAMATDEKAELVKMYLSIVKDLDVKYMFNHETIKQVSELLRAKFGVSELELAHFNSSKVNGDISTT